MFHVAPEIFQISGWSNSIRRNQGMFYKLFICSSTYLSLWILHIMSLFTVLNVKKQQFCKISVTCA